MSKEYSFVSNSIDNSGALKIISGKYNGLIYSYGKVQFIKNGNKEQMRVVFEYNVYKTPDVLMMVGKMES